MDLGIRATLLILYYIIITLYFILSVGYCTDMGIMYKRCLGNAFQLQAKYHFELLESALEHYYYFEHQSICQYLKTYTPWDHNTKPSSWSRTRELMVEFINFLHISFLVTIHSFFSFHHFTSSLFIYFTSCNFLLSKPPNISQFSDFSFHNSCTKFLIPLFVEYFPALRALYSIQSVRPPFCPSVRLPAWDR